MRVKQYQRMLTGAEYVVIGLVYGVVGHVQWTGKQIASLAGIVFYCPVMFVEWAIMETSSPVREYHYVQDFLRTVERNLATGDG